MQDEVRTASVGCRNMQTSIAQSIIRFVQRLGDVLRRLFSSLGCCRREVRDRFFQERGVVAAACFEDQLARRCTLHTVRNLL
jgi:hypothetical protein